MDAFVFGQSQPWPLTVVAVSLPDHRGEVLPFVKVETLAELCKAVVAKGLV